MITPGEVFRRLVPEDLRHVSILGVEIDLEAEIAIDMSRPLTCHLEEQPERIGAWYRIKAKCHAAVDAAHDHYTEVHGEAFYQTATVLEERERKELADTWLDETDEGDMFAAKRAKSADRVANGTRRRYRRDFTDDYVGAIVQSDARVQDARKRLRDAKSALRIAEAVVQSLEHRLTCLNQLAAMANRRAGM